MSKGGYRGGSTLVGPGSGWFSRDAKTKTRDLGKARIEPRTAPRTELEERVAKQLRENRKAARRQTCAPSTKTQLLGTSETNLSAPREAVTPPPAMTSLTKKKKKKKTPALMLESAADRLARASYKKNEVETRKAIEVLRVRGAKVITERMGLNGLDVPVPLAKEEP
jgi:hypothetical protein